MFNIDTFDSAKFPSPCYIVDESALRGNLMVLDSVRKESGAKILLALKGFAMFSLFPVIREYFDGTCASGLYEARLGREQFGKEVHTFSPAFKDDEIGEIVSISNHVVFNSFTQLEHFRDKIAAAPSHVRFGLRVNPEHSEAEVDLYNPSAPGSRLGIRAADFEGRCLDGISGFHFHTLCEQNADALERTLAVFEEKFGGWLHDLDWVNFGGGHHITRADYDRDLLCRIVRRIRDKYDVEVFLEPGEAVALNTGVLVATVQDIVHNDVDIAILDVSVTCHMPDVLEMPYRPMIEGAGMPGEKPHLYRLGGVSCLAGDVVGDYSFDRKLSVGDRLVFHDMAHYTMVKTTMFNGVRHPSIAIWRPADSTIELVREFTYEDYRSRLS